MRAEFEALPEHEDPNAELKREEFNDAVKSMRKNKAPGMDKIPAEVWRHSEVAKEELFLFLQKIWRKEEVSANLSLCIFVMRYKKRDPTMIVLSVEQLVCSITLIR